MRSGLTADSDSALRVFIAVEIPDDVRDDIARLTSRFRYQTLPVRWVRRENLHLTLIFLGEQPPEFIAQVQQLLAETAQASPPFAMSLKDLGAFPSLRSPRVIWLGVNGGAKELARLADTLGQRLLGIGFAPEKRPFSPHLTIGRAKGPIPDPDSLKQHQFSSRTFPVERIVLFRSRLRPTGPIYESLAEFPLTG